jgi:pimeloyl-ACP methyl ester carboxylesterase
MNVVVNGLMVNYQKASKGKAIVLLHGWGDSSQTFNYLSAQLKDKYEIYSLDLPGFGGSQLPPKPWGLEDYADFLQAWINKVGLKPEAIVGHSYGGAVAITAVANGLQAKNLVLLASAGIRNKRPLKKKLMAVGAKAGKTSLMVLPAHKRRQVKQKFYGSIGSDLMLVPQMEETFRKIINQDIHLEAAKIHVPTLLIYGTKDKDTPVSDGKIFNANIAGSELKVVEAGHFLHQEQPGQVAELIGQFLEQNDSHA